MSSHKIDFDVAVAAAWGLILGVFISGLFFLFMYGAAVTKERAEAKLECMEKVMKVDE